MSQTVQHFALTVVRSDDLEEKLAPPRGELLDRVGDGCEAPSRPGRPPNLQIVDASEVNVPKPAGWHDPDQVPRLLHALANHELQAAELYARALLQFSAAPTEFRRDLLRILLEEQRHTRLYRGRLRRLGGDLGDYPVTGYFWNKAAMMDTPERFVAVMALTFENANLDHSLEYAEHAEAAGDRRSAAILRNVHEDEQTHVAFGWRWLRHFAGDREPWERFVASLTPPLHAGRASGRRFGDTARREAGLPEDFIAALRSAHGQTP